MNQLRKDELERAIKVFLGTGKIENPTKRILTQVGIKDSERWLSLRLPVRWQFAAMLKHTCPPFKGASFHGIEKLSTSLPKWISLAKKPKEDLALSAFMMDKAGTEGNIFRNFYRDFLRESYEIVNCAEIKKGHDFFSAIANQWHEVISLIEEASKTVEERFLVRAGNICKSIGEQETKAMKILSSI